MTNPIRYKMFELVMKQYGERYVWGGAGEDVWDCSGLVWYVLQHTGLYPAARTTAQGLYNSLSFNGESVKELEETEVMDIVFYGKDVASIVHVGFVLPPMPELQKLGQAARPLYQMIGANGTKAKGGEVNVKRINYHPQPIVAYIDPVIGAKNKFGIIV